MESLLPSLQNLPVFYAVLVSLLLLFGLSGYALYRRLRRQPPGPGLGWLKGLALLPLWLLCLYWTGVAVFMGVFAGAMAGNWVLPLLSLGLLPLFILLSWMYYRWIRGGVIVDTGALLLVPAMVLGVFFLQRLWLCEPLARSGLGQARVCTAQLYEHGEGGAIRHIGTARDWYRQAAEQGVAEAESAVAGFSAAHDEKLAWYTRAADHGNAAAAYQLYWLLEHSDPGTALQRLQSAVQQGHAGAQYRLGLLYLNAYGGVDRDLSRTRELWLQSARAGYLSAARDMAIACARGAGLCDYDPEASRHWEQQARRLAASHPALPRIEQVQEANWERQLQEIRERRARAEAGDMAAQLAIGREILQQAGTQAALLDTARGWIERAAASGSVEARYQLAEHYLAQDPDGEPGRHWLLAAADSGHEQALRKVITGFREATHGLPRDLEKSRAYSEALFTVLEARGVLKNEPDWLRASREYSETRQQIRAEADRYLPPEELRRQSDAGDPAAMYHRGRELQPTRFAEGVALITAAATAGYPQAQYEMARSYRTRARTQQEEQQAVDWLEAAAQRGHRGAMVDLGILYLQGIRSIGLEANPYRAKRLFAQALRDRKDTVYEQQTGNGRSWKYTVESVNRWLGRIPESVTRLDLEGLVGTQRREAIERWYAQEQQALLAQVDASSVGVQPPLQKQLEQLDQQRNALLNEDREAAE